MSHRIRLYLDLEFTGLHQRTTPISLALVCEHGQRFYAEFTDYDRAQVTPWIKEHVIDHLTLGHYPDNGLENVPPNCQVRGDRAYVSKWLTEFITNQSGHDGDGTLEIWADVPHYDWVLFCELFGGAFSIPKCIHYQCLDLATLLQENGIDPDVDRLIFAQHYAALDSLFHAMPAHHAMRDALLARQCHEILQRATPSILEVMSQHPIWGLNAEKR